MMKLLMGLMQENTHTVIGLAKEPEMDTALTHLTVNDLFNVRLKETHFSYSLSLSHTFTQTQLKGMVYPKITILSWFT